MRFAAGMAPGEVQSADLLDYLELEEWELVLQLLGEFDGHTWQTPRYWALLTEAAIQMDQDAAWFQWRCVESIQGVLRVELVLGLDAEPLPARGERPTWDVTGKYERVAALWIESKPVLGPGERATARLRPFVPPAGCREPKLARTSSRVTTCVVDSHPRARSSRTSPQRPA